MVTRTGISREAPKIPLQHAHLRSRIEETAPPIVDVSAGTQFYAGALGVFFALSNFTSS
jgi:hypothetical protein